MVKSMRIERLELKLLWPGDNRKRVLSAAPGRFFDDKHKRRRGRRAEEPERADDDDEIESRTGDEGAVRAGR